MSEAVLVFTGRIAAVESLFWYGVDESYSTLQDLNWVPYFTTGTVPSNANEVCGSSTQCYRDYYITQNSALAAATAAARDSAETVADILCK